MKTIQIPRTDLQASSSMGSRLQVSDKTAKLTTDNISILAGGIRESVVVHLSVWDCGWIDG